MTLRRSGLFASCFVWILVWASVTDSAEQSNAVPSSRLHQRPIVEFYAHAVRLLEGENWADAGEFLGGMHPSMLKAVEQAWNLHADWPAKRREQYRLHLAAFFFRHGDLIAMGWPSFDREKIRRLAEHYELLRQRVATTDSWAVINVSRAELLVRDWSQLTDEERDESMAELEEILLTSPSSIPAITAYRYLRQVGLNGNEPWQPPPRELTSPELRLAMAREIALYVWQDDKEAMRTLNDSWQLAPSRQQQAHLLNKLALLETRYRPGRASFLLAERVFENFPETTAASGARRLAAENVNRASGPDKALRFIKSMEDRGEPHTNGLDEARFHVSLAFESAGRTQQAVDCVYYLLRHYPDGDMNSRAMLRIAEIYGNAHDSDHELLWLERCAEYARPAKKAPERQKDIDFGSEAMERLALRYEERRRWADALQAWKDWNASSWCGTCAEGMRLMKARGLARCQVHLRQYSQAVLTCMDLLAEQSDEEISALIFALYAHCDQLDDLKRIIDQLNVRAVERRNKLIGTHDPRITYISDESKPTRVLSWLFRMHANADRHDTVELLNGCTQADSPQYIDTSTPSLFDTVVARIIPRGIGEHPHVIADMMPLVRSGHHSMALVLASYGSHEADTILSEFLTDGLHSSSGQFFSETVATALLTQGNRGRFLVQRVAASDIPYANSTASAALRKFDDSQRKHQAFDFKFLSQRSLPEAVP